MEKIFKYLGIVLIMLMGLSACKAKKKTTATEEGLAGFKISKISDLPANQDFKHLSLRGRGTVVMPGNSQKFRIEIRIHQNEKIWVDISDPILGIKVARALITPKDFAFYNRLDKSYAQGSLNLLYKYTQREIPFEWLHNLLAYKPVLQSKIFGIQEIENIMQIMISPPRNASQVSFSLGFDYNEQIIVNQLLKDSKSQLRCAYSNHQKSTQGMFPFQVDFEWDGEAQQKLSLEWNRVNFLEENDYPFSIPQGYVQIK